jgi:hypothetical protein
VLIVVKARPDSGDTISKDESPPVLSVVAVKTATIAMNNYFEAIADPERRKYFLRLPTNFALSRDQVDALVRIGPALLDRLVAFPVAPALQPDTC